MVDLRIEKRNGAPVLHHSVVKAQSKGFVFTVPHCFLSPNNRMALF